jgi:thioesterase domain-containing protein
VAERTGQRLHVATLFRTPTIADLAARLAETAPDDGRLILPLRVDGAGAPYFCVPGAGDNPFIFADIVRHLGADRPIYSFRFPDDLREQTSSPRDLVAAVAARLIDEIRAVQPRGPYLLGGYCFGGLVAFEMASRLHEEGERVPALTIFDMFLPGAFRMSDPRERIAHHLRYLQSVDWAERVGFLSRHGRRRLARLGRRLSPRVGQTAAALASDDDYVPRRLFPGRLTLFRASDQANGVVYDSDMGWRGLAESLEVHEITGRHTDVYKEPSVSRWVATLRNTLASADSGASFASGAAPERVSALGRSA